MGNGYLTSCALCIAVILTIIFLVKGSVNNIETKTFKYMLFLNIIEFAKQNSITTIIMSGDIFDKDSVLLNDKKFFYDSIKVNPEIDFYYIKGNHDSNSKYNDIIDNLHTFDGVQSYVKENVRIIGYELSDDDSVLYNYIPTDDGIYIQFASKDETKKSIIEYYSNDDISTLETDINTFENQINNTNLLFHNEGNAWILYNIVENRLNSLNSNLDDKDLYPKYLVVDKNKIIAQDFDNNFYIGTLQTH